MQDRGQPQLGKMRQLDAQRTACQLEMPRRLDQPAQRHAFQRHGVAAAQRVDVDAMTEVGRDHREASETAFGCFRLQHHRQPDTAAEIEAVLLHAHILL